MKVKITLEAEVGDLEAYTGIPLEERPMAEQNIRDLVRELYLTHVETKPLLLLGRGQTDEVTHQALIACLEEDTKLSKRLVDSCKIKWED